ncbi:MAG: HD domain-containing protein, partial [Acidimicrobiia bacterium]
MTLDAHLAVRERAGSGALPPASTTVELRATLDAALVDLARALPEDVAVLAVGGTGLGRLGAHTDVDLALVSDRRLTPDEVRPFLLPLWDAGLRVGHSVRTIAEAATAARRDATIACALLTRRLVAGDRQVAERLDRALVKSLRRATQLVGRLVEEERNRRVADPWGSTRPDLKDGRGGLRTIDVARWVPALESGRTRVVADPELDAIEAEVTAVRHAVHGVVGAKRDVLDAELLGPVAARLGETPRDLARRVLGLMDAAERLAVVRVPAIEPLWPPVDDRPAQVPTSPVLADAVAATRSTGRVIAGDRPTWTRSDRDGFRWLLRSPRGREVFESLRRQGWVDRAVPELGAVWLEPHLVPFHAHPVGGHSLRVLAELHDDPAFGALETEDREVLEWAALFHDVGKGLGGDHSEVGARRFEAVAARLRIPAAIATRSRRLIRHHLLLADIGTRLDPDDQAVRRMAARAVGDLDTLHLLAILTAADSRATGTDTWGAWRRSLIAGAIRAVEEELRGVNLSGPVVAHLARVTGRSEAEVVAHLAGMPDAYRTNNDPARIARHLEILDGEGLRWAVEATAGHTEIAVVAPSRPGLVADVAGALALHRCSVVDARCWDRNDGLAVDTFVVIDALGGSPPDAARIDAVFTDVTRAWDGAIDLAGLVAVKAHDYRARVASGVEVRVAVTRGEGSTSVLVECADRVGLLHELAATI